MEKQFIEGTLPNSSKRRGEEERGGERRREEGRGGERRGDGVYCCDI